MAHVLVTGAGGFLGSWVTRVFLDAGHDVRAGDIARADLSSLEVLGAKTVVCDVTQRASVDAALTDIDLVVHVAGLFDLTASPDHLWRVNAEGARVVARSCVEQDVKRVVVVSTSGVYGRCGASTTEDSPKQPINPYERSKWAGEQMALAELTRGGIPASIIRPTLIYGPQGRYGLAPWLALLALWRHRGVRRIHIATGGPLGHHVHVEDVARAAEHLATASNGATQGVFNVADETPLPGGSLIRVMAGCYGVDVTGLAPPWFLGKHMNKLAPLVAHFLDRWNPKLTYHWSMLVARQGLEPELSPRLDVGWLDYMSKDHTFDNQRLKETGFEFKHPDVRIGLVDTIDWYRAQRWLP